MPTSPSEEEYFHSRNIGASKPYGKNVYEIAVRGDFGFGIESAIADTLLKCNAKMIRQLLEGEVYTNDFSAEYFIDASNLNCSMGDLIKKLKAIQHVKEVHSEYREGYLYSHLIFPITAFRRARLIAFRADSLVRTQERLEQILESGAATIMYEEGRSYGETIVKNHRFLLGGENQQLLIENLKEASKATGWGIPEFEFDDVDRVRLRLRHPPLMVNGEWKEIWLLYGAFAGMLEDIFEIKLSVDRSEYSKESDTLVVVYKRADRK
ncbi:MAG: hypothetical protein M1587_11445 [Thaumarchaeota archaeon]|nr:hypothetical protein [Nitrososphaerota archaeon]